MAAASSIHTSSACSSLWLSPGWMYWELKGGAGMKKEGQGEGKGEGEGEGRKRKRGRIGEETPSPPQSTHIPELSADAPGICSLSQQLC